MAIKYDRLIRMMKEHGINSYTVKRDKIIGQATYKKIMNGEYVNLSTIDTLCGLFHCQPGDILEYVPDNAEESTRTIIEDRKELYALYTSLIKKYQSRISSDSSEAEKLESVEETSAYDLTALKRYLELTSDYFRKTIGDTDNSDTEDDSSSDSVYENSTSGK